MTALVARVGLIPMAVSHRAGVEVQRPLATVVIGLSRRRTKGNRRLPASVKSPNRRGWLIQKFARPFVDLSRLTDNLEIPL